METIRALILRLQQQSDQQINNSELLITVQELEAALQKAISEPVKPVRMGNISVVLPSGNRLHSTPQPAASVEKQAAHAVPESEITQAAKTGHGIQAASDTGRILGQDIIPKPEAEKNPDISPVHNDKYNPKLAAEEKPPADEKPASETQPVFEPSDASRYAPKPAAEVKPLSLTKPPHDRIYAETEPDYETSPALEPVPDHKPAEPITVAENFHLSFAREDEAKKHSASQQLEMNDIFSQSSSLNDRLKADQKEVASVLHEEPVKDLRRAIGINDRFVYLNELFRGDEVMYERSLKTINSFRIYPEAEYWIERELKVKMGWDESKETVKQFRQLVRRRFQA